MAALAAVVFLRLRRIDVEPLIPVVTDSSIPLVLRLESAIQGAGFPPHQRHLYPFTFDDQNLDDPGIPIPMPVRGSMVFESLPVGRDARLRFGYGIERIENGQGVDCEFRVAVRRHGDAAETPIFAARLQVGAPGSAPQRQAAVAPLPAEFVGALVDLVFSTDCAIDADGAPFVPSFTSPVLESQGRTITTERQSRRFGEVIDDLLARYAAAIEADDQEIAVGHTLTEQTCFAIRKPGQGDAALIAAESTAVDPAFLTGVPGSYLRHGGPWPAVVFCFEGTLVRYPVDVPAAGARLEFAIGVDHRSAGVGAASFAIDIDGERVFDETLDPPRRVEQRGFHPRSIDLAAYAGRHIEIALLGEVHNGAPQQIVIEEAPPIGLPVQVPFEIRRVRAGFARPRIVADREVRPRLAARDRRSVILINVETLRADALGCYGGSREVSPAIDRLAADGLRVEECISCAPWTAPSVASTLTGLYPWTHGVTSYSRSFLADSVETLAERVRAAGAATLGIVSNDLVSATHNFDQGFDEFLFARSANARQLLTTFQDWLPDHQTTQFFAYLHLFEPHDPCNAPGDDFDRFVPEPLRGADHDAALQRILAALVSGQPPPTDDPDVTLLRGRYLGEIRYLDRQIERLREYLDRSGLAERVLLVVTSDHGEEFLEHGLIGHGSHLYRESVRVPMILYGPGLVPRGGVQAGPLESRLLFGTVLDAMGIERRPDEEAIDLLAGNSGGRAYSCTEQGIREVIPPDLLVKTIHSVRTRDTSFLYSPKGHRASPDGQADRSWPAEHRLFDLAADPDEQVELHAAQPLRLAEMKRLMKAAYERARQAAHGLAEQTIDAVTRQRIAELGYSEGSRTNSEELFEDD